MKSCYITLTFWHIKLCDQTFSREPTNVWHLIVCVCGSPEESEATLQKTKEVQKKAEEKYKVLENKMKNKEAEREKELKAAQKKLNEAKSKADAYNKKLKEQQQVDFIFQASAA